MHGFGVDPGVQPASALAMVLIKLTSGPNLAWPALLGPSRGRRTLAVAGVTVGLSVWLLQDLFGLTRKPLYSPVGLEILRWVGAGYLAGPAWAAVRPGHDAGSHQGSAEGEPLSLGLIANLPHPKAAIFYLALLPSFVCPVAGLIFVQSPILGAIRLAISTAIHNAAMLWSLSIPLSPGPAT